MFTYFVKQSLLPPVSLFVLLAIVLGLYERKKLLAKRLAWTLLVMGFCLCTKIVSDGLAALAERVPAVTLEEVERFQGDCIVILGGGVYLDSVEFSGAARPSRSTLERLNYGHYLARHTKLPVLVSGGFGENTVQSEAQVMATTLRSWGLTDLLEENDSRNTDENAKLSAKILLKENSKRVILVTSASHMSRAAYAFRETGLEVLPAPTAFLSPGSWDKGVTAWLPTFRYFESSCDYIQALVAEAWYWVKL